MVARIPASHGAYCSHGAQDRPASWRVRRLPSLGAGEVGAREVGARAVLLLQSRSTPIEIPFPCDILLGGYGSEGRDTGQGRTSGVPAAVPRARQGVGGRGRDYLRTQPGVTPMLLAPVLFRRLALASALMLTVVAARAAGAARLGPPRRSGTRVRRADVGREDRGGPRAGQPSRRRSISLSRRSTTWLRVQVLTRNRATASRWLTDVRMPQQSDIAS
jgi:hypothetical protein